MSATTSSSSDPTVKKEKTMMMMGITANDGGGRDLISGLPDPILLHILSYLDMTYVIQTSLLSKRWRYIWASLSILNFDYKVYNTLFEKQRFPFFVAQLLIRCNVQAIDFYVALNHLEFVPEFPKCLFTCKSLTTLKLDIGGHIFDPPSVGGLTVCLPALKTLHLKSLNLWGSVEMLISSSPVLETLIIDSCSIWETGKLTVSNAQLKKLLIKKTYLGESGLELYDQGRLDVFAPKLESFSSTDDFNNINRYSFVKVPSLVHAEIDTEFYFNHYSTAKNEDDIENVLWCLRGIYNVKFLKLSVWLLELVTEVPERLEGFQIHPFHTLTFLQLKTSFSKNHVCAIMYLLGKCPNLETLVLKVTKIPPPKSVAKVKSVSVKEEECWEAESAPQCIMHQLKVVEIRDVLASVNELEFLKFLLKNATGLEKMVVFTTKPQIPENGKKCKGFGEKLISFRGASSSSIEIVFV